MNRLGTTARRPRPLLVGLLAGAVAGLVALVVLVQLGRPAESRRKALQEALGSGRRNALVTAVERTRSSVVTIRVEGPRRLPDPAQELLWFPFVPGRRGESTWFASGFFLDAQGTIVTNEHVVRDARRIVVSAGDRTSGMSVPAALVGVAPQFDLALLQVARPLAAEGRAGASPFAPAELGDSDDLLVGEWAIAIGSPFGYELGSLEPSVSVGVISAVQRDLPAPVPGGVGPYTKMIQTDAAINEGNSGGPLVNANGQVIGVNTVNFSSLREGSVGVNFAIPVNTVKWVAQELRDYGEVRKPWIGWSVDEVDATVRAQLDLPEEEGFLTVKEVVRDSPADRAGVMAGDVLRGIQGLEPYSLSRAERILFATPVGADVEVEILRDGQLRRTVLHVIEDPYTRAEREARARRPLG